MNEYGSIRSRVLLEVAKAAWHGELADSGRTLAERLSNEFEGTLSRRAVVNEIRVAMGLRPLQPHETGDDFDPETLIGVSHPIVIAHPEDCVNCPPGACGESCPTGAIIRSTAGVAELDESRCLSEGLCLSWCPEGAIAAKTEIVTLIELLKSGAPVFASVAPAFAGQFGPQATLGRLQRALRMLGFTDMVETALAADMLTLKEALEFAEHVHHEGDFFITSCCCPAWIKLLQSRYPQLLSHVSGSVSPMVASGRLLKKQVPEAKVVFIGPCLAKKGEAAMPDVADAVDLVLTFKELETIFQAVGIDFAALEEDSDGTASTCGRIYARSGGVSEAVAETIRHLMPEKAALLSSHMADGIPECIQLLQSLPDDPHPATFIEGMACKGGCVGGPARLISVEAGREAVNQLAAQALSTTPAQNRHLYADLLALQHAEDWRSVKGESVVARLLDRDLSVPSAGK